MGHFKVIPERSRVWVEARSTLHTVVAKAEGITGFIEAKVAEGRVVLDPQPRARFEFPVEALRSGNPLFDQELPRRVNARRYPTVAVEVKGVSAEADGYRVRAQISFHGVTREVEGSVTVRTDGNRLVVEGEQVVDIRDFGLEPPRLLLLRAYPDVKVRVYLEAEKEA